MARVTLIVLAFLLGMGSYAAAQGYLIQVGDRLEISVLEDPNLNRTVLVLPDGRITLPLAGTVEAGGRTPEAVQASVRRALSRQFVEPPTVTVSVVSLGAPGVDPAAEGTTAQVYVLGQVSRPGAYTVQLPIDALRVLALAGGPGTFAARSRVQIRRRGADGGETLFLLDYDNIERGNVPSTVVPLADGDVIVVPERRLFE